jgi:anti-sigma-K factor RskA
MTPDVHMLTGAYAIDALDAFERRQFERHLAECPDCAREVGELRATAARLGAAVTEQPPDRLRRNVLRQIADTRQESPDAGRSATRRPRRLALRLTAAAAVVALAVAVAFGVIALNTQRELDATRAQNTAAAILAAPDARSAAAGGAAGGTAIVTASRELNRAVLMVSGLPGLPPDRSYEAWLMGQGNPRSVGLISNGPARLLVFGGLRGEAKFGVTVEPAGGSPQPTTTPVMLFDLPA